MILRWNSRDEIYLRYRRIFSSRVLVDDEGSLGPAMDFGFQEHFLFSIVQDHEEYFLFGI